MDTNKMLKIKRKGILYGLVDKDGQVVFPFKYEKIKPFDIRGHTIIKEYEGNVGVVDIYGNIVVPLLYDKIETLFSSGPARAIKEGKYGCIDIDGNEVVPFVYDSISNWGAYLGGTALVKQKGKYGVINKNGDVIVPIKYKEESEAIEKNIKIDKTKIHNTKAPKIRRKPEEIKDKEVRGFFPSDNEVDIPSSYTKIGFFEQGNAIVFNDGKYGLINMKCEIVIPTKYDFLRYVKGGVLYACTHGTVGLIDEDDDIIAPFIYDFIDEFPRNGLLSVCRGGKLGFINLLGDEIIPAIYDIIPGHFSVSYERNGRSYHKEETIPTYNELISYKVYNNNSYTIHGNNYNTYDVIGPFIHNNNYKIFEHSTKGTLIIIRLNSKWGLVYPNGDVFIPFEYDYIGIKEDRHFTEVVNSNDLTDVKLNGILILVQKNGKWGFVNEDFIFKVPCVYDIAEEELWTNRFFKYKLKKDNNYGYIYLYSDGRYTITVFKYNEITSISDELSIVRKGSKYGVINEDFQEIIPLVYDKIENYLYDNKLKLKFKNKWGWVYFDENHNYTFSPFIYEEIEDYTDGLALVRLNGQYGYINENWDIVIPLKYQEAFSFLDGIATVKKNGLWGVIDTQGSVLVPFEYEKLANFSWLGPSAIVAMKNGKCGIIDIHNKTIVSFEYNNIFPASSHLIVEKDGLKGLLDFNGNAVIPIYCTEIEYPMLNIANIHYLFKYKTNEKWGLYDDISGIIVSAIYDEIPDSSFTCGRISVCRGGKWGFINTKGKEVIPCIYDENPGTFYPNQSIEVSLNGEIFHIDTKGNKI